MTTDDFISSRILALEESVKFFGSQNKTERELWVCEDPRVRSLLTAGSENLDERRSAAELV
jgi:hypothetical protein